MKFTKVVLWIALTVTGFFIAGAANFSALSVNVAYGLETQVQLTEEEEAFIRTHPVVSLAVDPEFTPYEFVDKDGKYKGIAADYIKLICERTGLKMEPVYGLSWAQAYGKAELGEIDVLPCVSKTNEREKAFLFSKPYYTFKRVIFLNENEKNILTFDDLIRQKVAVQENSSHYGFLKGYPSIQLSLYQNVGDALKAVSDGRETAFVGNLATSGYLMKANGITNLKYIEINTGQNESLYFAVRNDWPELVGIINKGIDSITEEEKISIHNHWLGVEKQPDYTRIILIAGAIGSVVAVILIVSFFWILRLKKEIRERRNIEEALRIAKEEAESANSVKSTFLARMSHEIRTPLNAITGIAYLLMKTDVTATQKIYLDKITQASSNMLGIINDILDFAKIEAGKIQLETISFNLDEVLQKVVNIESYKIEEEAIDFFMEKEPDLPVFFFGDPTRVEQILLNLLNNAIKFTTEGSVNLSIKLLEKEGASNVIQITVRDTGIGMTEDQIQQLFEPFQQADSSISRRFGGTGLGLSIVRSLVAMMGGTVHVESEVGQGSAFSVTLRLTEDTGRNEERRTISKMLRQLKVLVIDKKGKSGMLLQEYLGSFGINADYTKSADLAFEMLKHQNGIHQDLQDAYDLIILDYETMSDESFIFAKRLRDEISGNKPKLILIIPLMKEEILEKISVNGIELGIAKPVVPSTLYNGILELFKSELLELRQVGQGKESSDESAFFSCHILVVEDNKTNQFIAREILEQSGFKVSAADDGQQGFDFFTEHQHDLDLILMDLHMPVLNGYDTARLIRNQNKDIPIVAMTADAVSGVIEKCMEAGMRDYISKPFEPGDFIGTVKRALKQAGEINSTRDGASGKISQGSVEQQPQLLDQKDGLQRIGGNEEIYRRILAEFYDENKSTLSNLEEKIEKHDYEEVKQILHKVKGSAGNIGVKKLPELAADFQRVLEEENQDENQGRILNFYEEFKEQMIQLENEVKEILHSNLRED